ncbi:kinase-like domain-containing protein [Choanephora cucurbitarum]|nr:kinase-like domain-containing protein [Choanephora cucurbitarum]
MNPSPNDVIVGEQWLVLAKIGQGSFGEVFEAQDIVSKQHFAIKREPLDLEQPQLHHENKIYDVLKNGPGIPTCHWYGQFEGFDCIVIDLLGTSIKQLQETVRFIPLDVVIDLGCQMISTLEYIHDKGIVYRDIKPENILFSASCTMPNKPYFEPPMHSPPPSPPSCRSILSGWDKKMSVYLVDFGLATWWRNPKTKKPYPECKKPIKYKTGTARYASLNVHRGRTHARRDDLESLGYVLLDLLLAGELPWSGITAKTCKQGWDHLKSIKEEMLLEDICLGLPRGIMDFIGYTRRLRYNDRPDYDHLRRLLRGCLESGPFSKPVMSHANSRLMPSPPRYYQAPPKKNHNESFMKRRTSVGGYRPKSNEDDSVFRMDDLVKELPSHKSYHSSSSPRRHRHPSSSSQNRNYRKHNGWNSHAIHNYQWEK